MILSKDTNNTRCQHCNHVIKKSYNWKDQILGIECWKKIVLPEIERIRAEKFAQWKKERWQADYALVEALKQKDMSKIKSEFKKKFITSIISQFEEKGFISSKQKEIINGTGAWNGSFYDNGMLNNTDKMNEIIARYKIGMIDTEYIKYLCETFYSKELEKNYLLDHTIGGEK